MTHEEQRVEESWQRTVHWKRWGPYLSERAWGTVREDYSPYGTAWDYFPHDQARSKAYRWGEDGIGGICDRHQFICFALALWNGHDPILKERLFGLTGNEGNHGEDGKEYYFYLDSTPTHSYMKFLYKYPQAEYPYAQLVEENRRRSRQALEYELLDTGVFNDDRYFDVFVEYAKGTPEDILIRIQVTNRGPETVPFHLLPTIWFRNTWSWGYDTRRPRASQGEALRNAQVIDLEHYHYGHRVLFCEGAPELLFTENESNNHRLYGTDNASPYVKDGINNYLVHGALEAVNPERMGTKAAAHYALSLGPGECATVRWRFSERERQRPRKHPFGTDFEQIFATRRQEADEFYATVIPQNLSSDAQTVMRQAFAGLLWSKQFYHYVVEPWLRGDAAAPPPPGSRWDGRNHGWMHLYNDDVISMPDKWEYPWYAAWDLAFHCIPLALVDSDFAKQQLVLMLREWYMHPNGQLPAYEWSFDDVNPPVHAWAAWRVYKIEQKRRGVGDRIFLEHVFHKLLLNFTWWVNRKDAEGRNIFQGGFLELDNIGVFDRSAPLPTGGHIEQSDGTAWMGMYCLNMLAIALELARENPAYENVASKFFEHFVYIAHAMDHRGGEGIELWDDEDGFYYDVLHLQNGDHIKMRLRSMVGLIPLFAVETLEPDIVNRLPGFKRRLQWFIENRPDFREHVEMVDTPGGGIRRLRSIVNRQQLPRVLRLMLDEAEFLSPYGIPALSQRHRDQPYTLAVNGVVEKGIAQAYEIQRRLRVWRPRRAAVMGGGTVGLLATLVLRLRDIEVTTFALSRRPYRHADLIEALGARYESTADVPILEGAKRYGPFDLMFEATGFSPIVFESMQALGKNGVLVLSSVTGGDRKVEVPADQINLQFVLGNKVMVGTVNANREYFEIGVRDMAQAEAEYPSWLGQLLTHPVKGLEHYQELFDSLTMANGAIKIYCEVADLS